MIPGRFLRTYRCIAGRRRGIESARFPTAEFELTEPVEVVGSSRIEFDDFGIEPPSVAGFVTVEDQGTLEFKLRLRAS